METKRWNLLAGGLGLTALLGGCNVLDLPDGNGLDSWPGDTEGGTGGDSANDDDEQDDDDTDGAGGDPTGGLACADEFPDPEVFEHDQTIVDDEVWGPGLHRVSGSLFIEDAVEVEPCATIVMESGAEIIVGDGGSLRMAGEAGEPILVTSSHDSGSPGDWAAIRFEAGSDDSENRISHTIIEFGGGGGDGGLVVVERGAEASVTDSVFRSSEGYGIVVLGGLGEFVDNEVKNNEGPAVWITPDAAGDLGPGTYGPNADAGIYIEAGFVERDQTWAAHDAPYVVPDGFAVGTASGSAHLTVEAGAELRFGDSSWLEIELGGGLTLAGTEADPIVLGSAKSSGSPGDWRGILVEPQSVDALNRFSWVEIRDAGQHVGAAIEVRSGATIGMENSKIHDTAGIGLLVAEGGSLSVFENNTITDNVVGIQAEADVMGSLGPGTYGPNAQEGVFIDGGRVVQDARWLDLGVPYIVGWTVQIGGGGFQAGVTLSAGARVGLAGTVIEVGEGGWLELAGTAENQVLITSANSPGAPGDWRSIELDAGSVGARNVFRHARIEYGGDSSHDGALYLGEGAAVTLDHVEFASLLNPCDIGQSVWGATVNATATTYVLCE